MQSFLGFLAFILVLIALMVTRTPVAVALGTIGILGTAIFISPDALRQLGNIAFTQSSNFVLVVVPLFVLMGEALAATGIGNDLFRAAHMWLRRLPGALAVATVFACAVFAAVCGSTVGVLKAAAPGWLAVHPQPQDWLTVRLERRRYAGGAPATGERRSPHQDAWVL